MSMEGEGVWNLLPSIILIEILSYLPLKDRINSCSTCKNWRPALFHPNFWRKIVLEFKRRHCRNVDRGRFVASFATATTRSCKIRLENDNTQCLLETQKVLASLSRNSQLQELIIEPTHCHALSSTPDHDYFLRSINKNHHRTQYLMYSGSYRGESIVDTLQSIILNARSLKLLSLGCLQELTDNTDNILSALGLRHGRSLTSLSLASVKYDPNAYALLDITPEQFMSFANLQILTLDYDYINDRLLRVLSAPFRTPIQRLSIHVHGIDETHCGTTEFVWYLFKQHNPQCSLVLNLLHSYDGVELLSSGLLHPSMPLTHFRAFFCEWINIAALRMMSNWYSDSLRHLTWVDCMDNDSWGALGEGAQEGDDPEGALDPLVMLAWRCKRLRQLTLIGYGYAASDVVAIARLRGNGLQMLNVPEDCLEVGDEHEIATEEDIGEIVADVSEGLGRTWSPLAFDDLHASIQTTTYTGTDELILPFILSDVTLE